ncbi:hypothetical protein AGMMS49992_05990 [Clostridia bacterium]|nr:hypothetical protein AGMMS49992_05990 [Clostridia bacterium]
MLYPGKNEPLTAERFANPGREYRATPFWAWNNKLDSDELRWQIEQFKRMGFGGFHMHVRTGMATEYLSDEYMQIVRDCVEKARQEDMLAWLYDEDRWPSGAAGGFVTKNPKYRQRYLLFTREKQASDELLFSYDIVLNSDGTLKSYDFLKDDKEVKIKGFALYVYAQTAPDNPWYNNQAYLNTLDPESVQEFIKVTYERYLDSVGEDFGGLVPAIFTDEPQFSIKRTLAFANDTRPVTLPWTPDLPESFERTYHYDITAGFPELLWDLPDGKTSLLRYHYHDHISDRFASAFADQCGKWCGDHGLMLTGHLMEESSLKKQTAALGDAMRSYRSFQLPGIDMLCDWHEYTTAKQAQSAAHQFDRPGVLSELYGVTNWDFDFRGHKLQGDWQAALGVTVRVPHLSWVSMNGEAKRDYPGTFNYQAPWYQEYPYIEDHFARVASVLTRGRPLCRVGVIHPVESYWLHWGAEESTREVREQMDRQYSDLTEWLLRGSIDFDFICESLLPDQTELESISGGVFPVGSMNYDVIIVPPLETIRSTTLARLDRFAANGGRIVCLGKPPRLLDAKPDDSPTALFGKYEQYPFERVSVLDALDGVRELLIRDQSGGMTSNLLHQFREEDGTRWLFICHADNPRNKDIPTRQDLRISIRGLWQVKVYDTITGTIEDAPAESADGWTTYSAPLYDHDSLLLRLDKTEAKPAATTAVTQRDTAKAESRQFLDMIPVTLSEPNVLLLDLAEYSLDSEPFRPLEEILRLDDILRVELGWPKRGERFAQPWVENDASTPNRLDLRYTFTSDEEISGAELALENAALCDVKLNGVSAGGVSGYYVDKSIGKRPLPTIIQGVNTLNISIPYGKKVNIEACYLLGSFGVTVRGIHLNLTKPIRELAFGDITRQGLPFYGGNITYHIDTALTAGRYELSATEYRGMLMRAAIDGADARTLVFSPYALPFALDADGTHRIDVTLFGSRVNTFGQVHHANKSLEWWGPQSWRSKGAEWSYEYALWPQGILKSVEIRRESV